MLFCHILFYSIVLFVFSFFLIFTVLNLLSAVTKTFPTCGINKGLSYLIIHIIDLKAHFEAS